MMFLIYIVTSFQNGTLIFCILQEESGSPVIVIKEGRHGQIAVASWCNGICPTLRTNIKVSSFVEWISSITGIQTE